MTITVPSVSSWKGSKWCFSYLYIQYAPFVFTHNNAPGLPPKQKPSQIFFHRGKYTETMVASKRTSLVCGLEHFLFSIIYIYISIYGMSSFPWTFIFLRGVGLYHQPVVWMVLLNGHSPPTKGDDHKMAKQLIIASLHLIASLLYPQRSWITMKSQISQGPMVSWMVSSMLQRNFTDISC